MVLQTPLQFIYKKTQANPVSMQIPHILEITNKCLKLMHFGTFCHFENLWIGEKITMFRRNVKFIWYC